MLIDASGSMSSSAPGYHMSCISACNAVVSAFSKAVHTVLKDEIKVEVFLKTNEGVSSSSITGTKNGAFVTLTRVLTNSKVGHNDFDSILRIRAGSPLSRSDENGGMHNFGSYTPEFATLPGLMAWAKKNVRTKNLIVFNLTDGESYACIGGNDYNFGNEDCKHMRLKYLRGVPNLTLLVGGHHNKSRAKETYGELIMAEENFHVPMFKVLLRFINEAI
jgi:hypothetical protein